MDNPISLFTIHEAQDHYKGNPKVRCLADEKIYTIDSATLHSEKMEEYPESWIWAHSHTEDDEIDKSVLLYAPSKIQDKYVKAEIIE